VAISFVNVGVAGTGGSGNVTPAAPAALLANDILILCGHSRDNVAWSVDNGYTSLTVGNGSSTTNRIEMWWKRTTGVEGTTTVTHTAGNSIAARIFAYRGCVNFGNPHNVAGTVQANAGSPITTTAITTTVPGCLVLHLYGSQDDNTWGTFTGSVLTVWNNRGNATDAVGTDDSMGLADAQFEGVGTTGTASATQASLGPDAGGSVLVALRPQGFFQFNNYQSVKAGSGISVSERIR
jgi:hypothetical protein